MALRATKNDKDLPQAMYVFVMVCAGSSRERVKRVSIK